MKRIVNEKKLIILEKALSKNPGNEYLLQNYLKIGALVWDESHLVDKWNQVLENYPNSLQLWLDYCNIKKSLYTDFSVSGVLDIYENLFKIAAGIF